MRRKGENECKWWRSVFWRLVETSVINAFVIYKNLYPDAYKARTFQDFRVALVIQLASKYKENQYRMNFPSTHAWVLEQKWFKKDGHAINKGMLSGTCV
jgi:anti-sigma-K factor RskA